MSNPFIGLGGKLHAGVSGLAFAALLVTSLIAVVLFRMMQGRSLSALGRNRRAANLDDLPLI